MMNAFTASALAIALAAASPAEAPYTPAELRVLPRRVPGESVEMPASGAPAAWMASLQALETDASAPLPET